MLSIVLPSLLCVAVAPPPQASDVEASEARGISEQSTPQLQRGVLRIEGVDRSAFVEALGLRVPHLRLETMGEGSPPGPDESVAFIDLRTGAGPGEDGTRRYVLTIVVSDGRAFDREIDMDPDEAEPTRLLASTVANLLLAIEAGTVRADRDDVPLPVLEPECPECECPQPPACPVVPEPAEEPPDVQPESVVPPRIELAPRLGAFTVLGLGQPARSDRFAAYGVTTGLHARLRRGAFFGAELRVGGRGHSSGTQLLRLRTALGAGVRLRRGSVSLGASLWGTVEPWWLRGAPIDPPPRPLWGLAARLNPALYHPRLGDRDLALRIGPVIELAASGSLGDGGAAVGEVVILDGDEELGRMRVGGLELTTGLSATLWIGRPRSRRGAGSSALGTP